MTKVAVFGGTGRLGSAACRGIEAASDLDLVAVLGRSGDREEAAAADVAVDLTHPDAVMDNLRFCVERGIHCVVGTSGFTPERIEDVRSLLAAHAEVGVLIAPNFSIGAVLMMRFAAAAAPYFESTEIVELHHARKADAPSGTARRTAELIAAARTTPSPDATTHEESGARGASVDGVRVHSVRLAGLVAHQEVLLGGDDQMLTIRHDSFSQASFLPGILLGIRTVPTRPGLAVGLEHYLDLG